MSTSSGSEPDPEIQPWIPPWMRRRDLRLDLPEDLGSLNPQSVDASILAFARSRGIAADTVHAASCLDLGQGPTVETDPPDFLRAHFHGRQKEFKERIKTQRLEMSEDVRRELAMHFRGGAKDSEPDWKTLFPPVPSYNTPRLPPHLLTHEDELIAKAKWTERSLGTDLASKLNPNDSPLEIDRQHMPQMWQAIADYCMGNDTSTKLQCSKESLHLVADSAPGGLPGKALDNVYKAILPKLMLHSPGSQDMLHPLDESPESTNSKEPQSGVLNSPPKRKHTEIRDSSPMRNGPPSVNTALPDESISPAVEPSNSPRPRVLVPALPPASTCPKKFKSTKSAPPSLQHSILGGVDCLSSAVSSDNTLNTNNRMAPSLANSMINSLNPHSPALIEMAFIPIADSFGEPTIHSASCEVPAVPSGTPAGASKNLEDNESNQFPLNQPIPLSIRNKSSSNNFDTSRALGSLARFMDTRGIPRSESQVRSRHFIKELPQTSQERDRSPSISPPDDSVVASSVGTSWTVESRSNTPALNIPTAILVLFLSTALLETHLHLVKALENLPYPPKIVFRDYNLAGKSPPGQSFYPSDPRLRLPEEADVIIAPNAGVMLTNIQALTQLYLPSRNPRFPGLRRFNGPVLSRVLELSPRYEYLYVLVCHHEPQHEKFTRDLDAPSKEAIASLTIYCELLQVHSKIIPLIVKSPDKLASTIVSLSYNHISLLPPYKAPKSPDLMNPVVKPPILPFHQIVTDPETRWEQLLRSLGFNPFAARLVLGILEARDQGDDFAGPNGMDESKSSALCVFLEMSVEELLNEFKELVGEMIIWDVHRALRVRAPEEL